MSSDHRIAGGKLQQQRNNTTTMQQQRNNNATTNATTKPINTLGERCVYSVSFASICAPKHHQILAHRWGSANNNATTTEAQITPNPSVAWGEAPDNGVPFAVPDVLPDLASDLPADPPKESLGSRGLKTPIS